MEDNLSEDDVSVRYITQPIVEASAIVDAGWDAATHIRSQVSFTRGRTIVRGRLVSRGKARRADSFSTGRVN